MMQALCYRRQIWFVVVISILVFSKNILANDSLAPPIKRPLATGFAILDEDSDIIASYIAIIKEINQTNTLGSKNKEFFHDEITRALNLFSPCIESGPSFLAIKKYWKKFNKNIKKLQESSSIDIPFLHIVGLKLILLADLSHFSSVKKARQFLVDEREDRERDSIISQYKIFIGKIFIYEHCNIKDILRKSLNYNYKKIQSIEELKKTIPFFSCRGVFGINGLLYAYFNKLLIQSYPVIGNDQAHNGKWGSFSRHVQFFPNDPDATGSLFKEEKFLSSVLFAEHDRKHNESIRYYHKESHALYLPFYEKFSFDPANKVQSFLQIITLFFVVYEVPHITSIEGFKNMLTMIFREYDDYEGPESYSQLIALKDIDDFKQLIVASGVAVQFNEDEPWKNGPMVREVLLPVYKNMYNFFIP